MWHVRSTLAVARWVSQAPPPLPLYRAGKLGPQTGGTACFDDGRRPRHVCFARNQRILLQYFPQTSTSGGPSGGAKHNMAREVDPEQFDRRLVEFFSQMVDSPQLARSRLKARPRSEPLPAV